MCHTIVSPKGPRQSLIIVGGERYLYLPWHSASSFCSSIGRSGPYYKGGAPYYSKGLPPMLSHPPEAEGALTTGKHIAYRMVGQSSRKKVLKNNLTEI